MNRDLARETLATYLLQSLAIEDACAAGARTFHMGESDTGSAVEQYKAYFGATPVDYRAVRLERLPLTAAERRLRGVAAAVTAWRARRSDAAGSAGSAGAGRGGGGPTSGQPDAPSANGAGHPAGGRPAVVAARDVRTAAGNGRRSAGAAHS
jgi:hypothetical protein